MSQVQNSTLHNFVQPALFIGAALLAGRVVEKFPGASKRGLLLSATLGSGFALASQKCAAENESAWHSLGRVTASLALGTILAPLAAKALKGRADITMPAALRFGLVEAVIAMGLAVISPFMPYAQLLNKHTQYTNNLEEWQALPEKRRTELVKEFYEADLPVIRLKNLKLDRASLDAALLTLEGDLSPWQEEILLTQDFRLLETLQHNPEADYSSLLMFLNRYPELKFLINSPFVEAVGTDFHYTINGQKGRIRSIADVNALTIVQLKGYHTAFDFYVFNYNNRDIHQAFCSRFRQLQMSTDTIDLSVSSGMEMKIAET